MDWYIDAAQASGLSELRREIGEYLRRHAADGSDIEGAELIVSELLANVHRHATGDAWVTIEWTGLTARLAVLDVGPGFDQAIAAPPAGSPGGRGLFIVSRLATEFAARRRALAGTTVTVDLPVRRAASADHDPPRHRTNRLPLLSAAGPHGFDRETFLLALAVQLAMNADERHGPDAADALVAQVGADIGAQMEAEFRAVNGLDGTLTTDEVASCLLRLKQAIGGGFRVLAVDESRIVLGNTTCPFGAVVRQAPSLCRMTSAVFGAIAASGTGRAVSVDLQERIAVGDDGCRVVIDLDPSADTIGHRYHPTGTPRRE